MCGNTLDEDCDGEFDDVDVCVECTEKTDCEDGDGCTFDFCAAGKLSDRLGCINEPVTVGEVDIEAPSVVEVGEPVFFAARDRGDRNCEPLFRWDFGDGSNAIGQFPTHSYTTPGVYRPLVTMECRDCATERIGPVETAIVVTDPCVDPEKSIEPALAKAIQQMLEVKSAQVDFENAESKLIPIFANAARLSSFILPTCVANGLFPNVATAIACRIALGSTEAAYGVAFDGVATLAALLVPWKKDFEEADSAVATAELLVGQLRDTCEDSPLLPSAEREIQNLLEQREISKRALENASLRVGCIGVFQVGLPIFNLGLTQITNIVEKLKRFENIAEEFKVLDDLLTEFLGPDPTSCIQLP